MAPVVMHCPAARCYPLISLDALHTDFLVPVDLVISTDALHGFHLLKFLSAQLIAGFLHLLDAWRKTTYFAI